MGSAGTLQLERCTGNEMKDSPWPMLGGPMIEFEAPKVVELKDVNLFLEAAAPQDIRVIMNY